MLGHGIDDQDCRIGEGESNYGLCGDRVTPRQRVVARADPRELVLNRRKHDKPAMEVWKLELATTISSLYTKTRRL